MKVDRLEIPIWQKYTMTIEEAAAYFHIVQRCDVKR